MAKGYQVCSKGMNKMWKGKGIGERHSVICESQAVMELLT